MSDIRHLDVTATDGGIKVNTLVRNCIALTAGTYNQEFVGFFTNVPGAAWTVTGIDAKESVSFTPQTSTQYWVHASSIVVPGGGTGHGYLPGYRYELVDAISTWTVDGTGDLTGGIFTVPTAGSSDLTSASSVLPVVATRYNYSVNVTSYTGATTAVVSYGGQELYNKGAIGVYSGIVTPTTAAGLVVSVTGATTDFVISSVSITRIE